MVFYVVSLPGSEKGRGWMLKRLNIQERQTRIQFQVTQLLLNAHLSFLISFVVNRRGYAINIQIFEKMKLIKD